MNVSAQNDHAKAKTPMDMDDVNFESALEDYLNADFGELDEGTIVPGEVVRIGKEFVLVDVNFKSEGQLPIAEFMDLEGNLNVKVGDRIDVFVVNKNESEGTIILSRERAKRMKLFDKLEDVMEGEKTITGRIVRRVKGGYTVDLEGIEAFLPGSHVDLRPVPDMDALVGQDFEFRVLKINRRRSNVIVSRRVLLEEQREGLRKELLSTLAEGQVVSGKVKNVTEYGVFVDLGGLDGLLHITDMSWKRIRHPKEMVQLGQELELKVLSFDRETNKVSLGLKQLVPDPWENIAAKFPEGQRFNGKVTNLVDYGAFVELEPGVEGLVHISEMSWTRKLRHPSQMVSAGEEVEVVILGVDPDKKRISLGMKQVKPNPWDIVAEKYPEGTILEGVIKNITEFGLFIGIEDGIDGLIHVSDISWTKKVRHPGEMYKVGDPVQAKVLTVDKENEKFTLGVKQLADDPWNHVPSKYPVGEVITGTVTNITDFGLFVEVEEGIEGLVHVSEISTKKVKDPAELFKEGVPIQAKVIHVSADERRLGLSIKQLKEEEERKRMKEFRTSESGFTLGDVMQQQMEAATNGDDGDKA
ncbi:ribosomal protein S1 [Alkalidesulfovibrio alkalitolerans DSM 16529]|uniref:Small ribosomal subunit protein bS1 n=1 Tax=Alkalidesulfovibrio alkalitolerans DSM 16529 TaxID=1121439 RepID=S7T760_9BACT|nr:30S ribosomal protein S1 [Alkalidesulfovibrio alkalitolerans]EPR32416.1 ribosomal protein S1 [Alkalidesulfovibrio alkalitolerans DSM 16529]